MFAENCWMVIKWKALEISEITATGFSLHLSKASCNLWVCEGPTYKQLFNDLSVADLLDALKLFSKEW